MSDNFVNSNIFINNLNLKKRYSNTKKNNNLKKFLKLNSGIPISTVIVEDKYQANLKHKILHVNGCLDISDKVSNSIVEMHNIPLNDNCINDTENPIEFKISNSFDSELESDTSEGNLSWLLNYKIQELPPMPDSSIVDNNLINKNSKNSDLLLYDFSEEVTGIFKPKNEDTLMSSSPKKPPFTYTELIEHALNEKGQLTVSGIYQWISDHFPFYKQNDDRWKNSVRHNLSINPHFRKGNKAVHGAGHLWTISQRDDKKSLQIKQRMQQFLSTSTNIRNKEDSDETRFDMELQAATQSILGEFDANPENEEKNNIEVEFINIVNLSHTGEVSKQQIVQESGLNNDILITDLNPDTLGVNLVENEVINDGNFYDDISLEYYQLDK